MENMKYLIIGNSVAAINAIEGIRSVDKEGAVTVISEEKYAAYGRPLISYWLGRKVQDDKMSYRPGDFYDKHRVDLKLGVRAESIDTETGRVVLSDGSVEGYDKLLIATGGKPIKLPMKGLDEVGYVNFIKYDDAKTLDELAVPGKTAMVIGGGFIGLKAAEALIKRGVRVELVEKADWVLSTMLDKEGASLVQAELAANGVSVRTGVVGESAVRNGDGAISVALSDGTGLVCDFIVVAVGVLPNTEVVKGTDIEVDRGILVDETMATSVPGVYAAGDVAQALDAATGQRRVSAILPNASIQGKTAGKSMAGEAVTYAGAVPFNAVGVFGVSTISMGSSNASGEGDEVFTAADSGSYRRIVVRDGKVLGALFVNELERAGIVQGLIRLKADISDRKDALVKGSLSLLRAWPSELRAEKLAK